MRVVLWACVWSVVLCVSSASWAANDCPREGEENARLLEQARGAWKKAWGAEPGELLRCRCGSLNSCDYRTYHFGRLYEERVEEAGVTFRFRPRVKRSKDYDKLRGKSPAKAEALAMTWKLGELASRAKLAETARQIRAQTRLPASEAIDCLSWFQHSLTHLCHAGKWGSDHYDKIQTALQAPRGSRASLRELLGLEVGRSVWRFTASSMFRRSTSRETQGKLHLFEFSLPLAKAPGLSTLFMGQQRLVTRWREDHPEAWIMVFGEELRLFDAEEHLQIRQDSDLNSWPAFPRYRLAANEVPHKDIIWKLVQRHPGFAPLKDVPLASLQVERLPRQVVVHQKGQAPITIELPLADREYHADRSSFAPIDCPNIGELGERASRMYSGLGGRALEVESCRCLPIYTSCANRWLSFEQTITQESRAQRVTLTMQPAALLLGDLLIEDSASIDIKALPFTEKRQFESVAAYLREGWSGPNKPLDCLALTMPTGLLFECRVAGSPASWRAPYFERQRELLQADDPSLRYSVHKNILSVAGLGEPGVYVERNLHEFSIARRWKYVPCRGPNCWYEYQEAGLEIGGWSSVGGEQPLTSAAIEQARGSQQEIMGKFLARYPKAWLSEHGPIATLRGDRAMLQIQSTPARGQLGFRVPDAPDTIVVHAYRLFGDEIPAEAKLWGSLLKHQRALHALKGASVADLWVERREDALTIRWVENLPDALRADPPGLRFALAKRSIWGRESSYFADRDPDGTPRAAPSLEPPEDKAAGEAAPSSSPASPATPASSPGSPATPAARRGDGCSAEGLGKSCAQGSRGRPALPLAPGLLLLTMLGLLLRRRRCALVASR